MANLPDKPTLDGIEERWGGPLEYLQSIGINEEAFDSIRENYLE